MRIAWLLVAALLVPSLAHGQRGVPQNGYPSWQERMMLVLANRARADPTGEPKACSTNTTSPPLIWNYSLNRASRFHCSNLAKTSSSLSHSSPCTVVSNIAGLYPPDGTCDGSASCACVGGAVGCSPECTTPWERMVLFGGPSGGSRAENVARGHSSPQAVHSGWMNSSGHCTNILNSNYNSLGAGWDSNYWTQKFWSGGTRSGTLIAGGHQPRYVGSSDTDIELLVNYYDSRGVPQSAEVNIDGACTPMLLERGSSTNATYRAEVTLSGTSCGRYVFVFTDPGGSEVVLPESGSYGLGVSGCADWSSTAPPDCGEVPDPDPDPPVIVQAANADPNPVDGSTTSLSVLASHDDGESSLVYTWSASGPTGVSFSPNGTNAAKASTASFTRAGSYTITATVTDSAGQSVTSSVEVVVLSTVTAIFVSPSSATVEAGQTRQFSAEVEDQFGDPVSSLGSIDWSVSGGGTIDSSGLFTAGESEGGPFSVTASANGVSGTASVSVTPGDPEPDPEPDPPVIVQAASANPNPVDGTTTSLSVLASHDDGESTLIYTWSASGPAAISFDTNGTNAAKASTASFTRAGSYTITATVTDSAGQSVTSSVEVVVLSTVTAIYVSPSSATVEAGQSRQFSAEVEDQFGDSVSPSLGIAWSVSGGGTIDSSGLFTAGESEGGPFAVTASAEGVSGTALVTVGDAGQGEPAPEVLLVEPRYGDVVSGTVFMLAEASDDAGVALVEFLVDGDVVGSSDAEPHEHDWDTEGWEEGGRRLLARATNNLGIVGTSEAVWVHLVDLDEDEDDPSLSVTVVSPDEGTEITERTLWVVAEATGDSEVVAITFEVNEEPAHTLYEEPWTVGLDVTHWKPGELVIVAVAEDAGEETARSEPVTVMRLEALSMEAGCGCSSFQQHKALFPAISFLLFLLLLRRRRLPRGG